jgi:hypothetical protein
VSRVVRGDDDARDFVKDVFCEKKCRRSLITR